MALLVARDDAVEVAEHFRIDHLRGEAVDVLAQGGEDEVAAVRDEDRVRLHPVVARPLRQAHPDVEAHDGLLR